MPDRNIWNNMTAMGTAKSGYIQRKIIKICEDIQVQHDRSIRDIGGKVYEFSYGDNDLDSTKIVHLKNEVNFCDVKRLTDMLNTSYERVQIDKKTSLEELLKDDDEDIEIEVETMHERNIPKKPLRKPREEIKEEIKEEAKEESDPESEEEESSDDEDKDNQEDETQEDDKEDSDKEDSDKEEEEDKIDKKGEEENFDEDDVEDFDNFSIGSESDGDYED